MRQYGAACVYVYYVASVQVWVEKGGSERRKVNINSSEEVVKVLLNAKVAGESH